MRHIKQLSNFDCGAASYAMITGIPVMEAIKECKTKKSGTNPWNVLKAFRERNYKVKPITVDLPFESVFTHLKLLSKEYPIYVTAQFICNSGRGRNSIRSHAIVINNEKVLDPAEDFELPMNAVGHLYNKELMIKGIILVGIGD